MACKILTAGCCFQSSPFDSSPSRVPTVIDIQRLVRCKHQESSHKNAVLKIFIQETGLCVGGGGGGGVCLRERGVICVLSYFRSDVSTCEC